MLLKSSGLINNKENSHSRPTENYFKQEPSDMKTAFSNNTLTAQNISFPYFFTARHFSGHNNGKFCGQAS